MLAWYSKGMPDALKKKYTDARIALDSLDNVSSAGSELAGGALPQLPTSVPL